MQLRGLVVGRYKLRIWRTEVGSGTRRTGRLEQRSEGPSRLSVQASRSSPSSQRCLPSGPDSGASRQEHAVVPPDRRGQWRVPSGADSGAYRQERTVVHPDRSGQWRVPTGADSGASREPLIRLRHIQPAGGVSDVYGRPRPVCRHELYRRRRWSGLAREERGFCGDMPETGPARDRIARRTAPRNG